MEKIIRLTESDLTNIVKRVISEKGPSGYAQQNLLSGTISVDCTKKLITTNTLAKLSPLGNQNVVNAFCTQRV
jgi:hypothetical protein